MRRVRTARAFAALAPKRDSAFASNCEFGPTRTPPRALHAAPAQPRGRSALGTPLRSAPRTPLVKRRTNQTLYAQLFIAI
jgi:hypothetical protein